MRSSSSRHIRAHSAAQKEKKLPSSPAQTWLPAPVTTPQCTISPSQWKITLRWVVMRISVVLQLLEHYKYLIVGLWSWTDLVICSSPDEKTCCGENAQRSHQHLHRAAQGDPGERVPQAGAQLQAGESRHPGDDRELPEAAAAAGPLSQRLQPGLLPLLEGLAALPLCWLHHRGLCVSSAGPPAAAGAAPWGPENQQLLPSLLPHQAHRAAGQQQQQQQQQRAHVEALVDPHWDTETWGNLSAPSRCRKCISSLLIHGGFLYCRITLMDK